MKVYLEKHPKDMNDMLSYQQQIQKMRQRRANWRYYDFKFRSDREYSRCKWNLIRIALEQDAYINVEPFRTQNKPSKALTKQNSPSKVTASPSILLGPGAQKETTPIQAYLLQVRRQSPELQTQCILLQTSTASNSFQHQSR